MLPWRSLAAVSVLSCWKVSISYQLLMLAALRANWDMWERKPLGASSSSTNTLANSRTSREMDKSLQICHLNLGNEMRPDKLALQGYWDKSKTTVEMNTTLKLGHDHVGGRKKADNFYISYQLLLLAALRANWDLWEWKPLGMSSNLTNIFDCLMGKWTEHSEFATSTWEMNQWQIIWNW